MAWTVNTFTGTRMTGNPSNYRTCMFELIRAVRERETIIADVSPSTFYKTNGTTSSTIAMSDLLNMKMFGVGNRYCDNLERIQDGIVGLIASGRFVTTAGGTTAYTLAAMESAIGTSLELAPESLTDARFWQAQKDALDRLIYVTYTTAGGTSTSTDRYITENTGGLADSTRQLAWNGRGDLTTYSATTPAAGFYSWVSSLNAVPQGRAFINKYGYDCAFSFASLADSIVVHGCAYFVEYFNQSGIDIDFTIGGAGSTIPASTYPQASAWFESATNDIGVVTAAYIDLEFTTAEPYVCPFSGGVGTQGARVGVTHARIYTNSALAFTDQQP